MTRTIKIPMPHYVNHVAVMFLVDDTKPGNALSQFEAHLAAQFEAHLAALVAAEVADVVAERDRLIDFINEYAGVMPEWVYEKFGELGITKGGGG